MTGVPTTFHGHLSDNSIETMVLETAGNPEKHHVDERSSKVIYRYLEYDQPIGLESQTGRECHWLVVVAKSNSWIITAYPSVTEPRTNGG